ncbi:hypothetical protein FOA43_001433 [Brettanomyces nanus]|uniref:Uncharacterized protein n=1 Tax=Eeniella nana TaxID=13502 RepID=A0A875RXD2_EENNA|nr:uncharacterized protein FOA43_001433 [Brettanomyces nanus]QPG74111.1 hypothetical protein FOA43_001433 [Brettanomyces nanus]
MVSVDVTSPFAYTTQARLLLCQLIYDTLSSRPKKFQGSVILDNFKNHPLICDPEMKLTEDQLVELVNNMMIENNFLKDEERDSNLPQSLEEYKDRLEMIIEACNIYFFKRIKEIEQRISENKEAFQEEYDKLKAS